MPKWAGKKQLKKRNQKEKTMERATGILLAITFFISLTNVCFADNEIIKKQYQFFGENDEFLAEIVTTAIKVRPVPKIPDEITKNDAVRLWQGKKIKPEKDCDNIFTGFINGIHAVKNCVETSAELTPITTEPLNITTSKKLYTENSAIIFWPILGIVGIFALAFIFIARGAPAVFMLQYASVIITSMAFSLTVFSAPLSIDTRFIAVLVVAVVAAFGPYLKNLLVDSWCRKCYELTFTTVASAIFQVIGTIITPIVLIFCLIGTSSIGTGIEFIWLVVTWFIFATFLIFVANLFPDFRKKYLRWI